MEQYLKFLSENFKGAYTWKTESMKG